MKRKHKKYEDTLDEMLKDPKFAAAYINAHLEDEDESEAVLLLALRDVARVYGFAELAEQTSLGRESLYKTLSKNGNPRLSTLRALLKAVGLKLVVEKDQKAS